MPAWELTLAPQLLLLSVGGWGRFCSSVLPNSGLLVHWGVGKGAAVSLSETSKTPQRQQCWADTEVSL